MPTVAQPYAHYKLNSTAGTTVIDDGSGSNNGTASVTIGTLTIAGKINNAFHFDGTDQNVEINAVAAALATDNVGSISFWFNTDVLATQDILLSLSYSGADGGTNLNFKFNQDGDWFLRCEAAFEGTAQWAIGANAVALSTGTYYHAVVIHDATAPKIYIDAVDVTNAIVSTDLTYWYGKLSTNNALDKANMACLAPFNGGAISKFFDGILDDVRIYQTTLTLPEIKAIYNNGDGTEDSTIEYSTYKYQSIIIGA